MSNGETARLRELSGLLQYPREDLGIEIKEWLDLTEGENKANLAQAMLALANHGGGYIVLGLTESEGNYVAVEPRPDSFDRYRYSQDEINGIIHRYADPPFHCTLNIVNHPLTGQPFPVITVPGGHRVPIRSCRSGPNDRHVKDNTYYIRRAGPQSAPPQNAQEWDALIRRCLLAARDSLIDDFRVIMLGLSEQATQTTVTREPQDEFDTWVDQSQRRFSELCSPRYAPEVNPYRHGIYEVSYWVMAGERLDPRMLLEILKQVEGHETGWPAWWCPANDPIRPYPIDDHVECWINEPGRDHGPSHMDFWRASPERKLFLIRGYDEDGGADFAPGTVFDLSLPIWRVGECLLHAQRFAEAIGQRTSDVMFHVTWTGLQDRTLRVWANRRRGPGSPGRRSRQDSVSSQIIIPAETILPGLTRYVNDLTRPLYNLFDFFEPAREIYIEELRELQRGVR